MGDNKTFLPLGAAAQMDNEPGRWDHIRPDQYDKPIAARMSASEIKAIGLVIGALGPGLLLLLAAVQWVSCWGQSYDLSTGCKLASGLFWGYVACGVLLALGSAVVLLWGRVARVRVETARAALTRDPYSNPVNVFNVKGWTFAQQQVMFRERALAEITMAPHKMLPAGLDVFTQAAPAKAESPALTAAPIDVGPLPVERWLTWLDDEPHAIFAAKTKGGKSTMAKVGLQSRIDRGEDIFIIDPHSNGWLDLPGVGGGLNWREVELALASVTDLYQNRMAERETYLQANGKELAQDYFPRVTVVFDEANESRLEIEKRHKRDSPWQPFVQIMGSGARKVGISLWLICQSALIKDLGGSQVMRRNFTVFALDHATITELIEDEERNKVRRDAIQQQIAGADYPAVTVIKGMSYMLDRKGIERMQPTSAASCAWDGWDCGQHRPADYRTAPAKAIEGIAYPAQVTTTRGRIAYLLISGWTYREIEHELSVSHATIREVSVALEARRKARESA